MKAAVLLTLAMTGIVPSRTSFAQMDMASHGAAMTMKEIPPPEQLSVPIKMSGIGNSHIAVNSNPEAQLWFDQGLNLLHDF